MKRLLTAAAVAFVAFGAVPAQAATGIDGTGSISHCKISGAVTFTPALTPGGTSPTSIKFSLALRACSGTGDGATVTGGRLSGTLGAAANDCNAVVTNTTGTLKVTYKVTPGSPALNPTTVEFVQIQNNHDNPVNLQASGATTSGSFFNLSMFANIHTALTDSCASVFHTGPPVRASSFSEG
jgi:hypothetical protein